MRKMEKDRGELLISQAQLEDRVAKLSSEMGEKEEYRVLQVSVKDGGRKGFRKEIRRSDRCYLHGRFCYMCNH